MEVDSGQRALISFEIALIHFFDSVMDFHHTFRWRSMVKQQRI